MLAGSMSRRVLARKVAAFSERSCSARASVSARRARTSPIDVPDTAGFGVSYARFRLSTDCDLGPTGEAEDGEVEDYQIVIGSAYTSDATNPPVAYMKWALKQMLEPGRIVILHDGRKHRQRTVDVLPEVLDEAARLGLRAVTVSDLMKAARP